MTVSTYSLTTGELQGQMNEAVQLVITAMVEDGLLPDDDALITQYIIVLAERGWFGKLVDTVIGRNNDNTRIHVMQLHRKK